MRVVHCDWSRTWRGGQQQLLLLARGLRARGYEQVLVAPHAGTRQRFAAAGLETMGTWAGLGRVRGASAVHAHDGKAHNWMLAATGLHPGARRILSRRVAFPVRGAASRWKYRQLDAVAAVSGYIAGLLASTGMEQERIHVIPDAIDCGELGGAAAEGAGLRSELGLEQRRCLVCAGALSQEKGVGDLLRALAALPAGYVLLLPGEGDERGLRRLAAELGVSERVHFTAGLGRGMPAWVAAGDVLVMPSRMEGFGSVALLAMALGRPVVATRVGGIPELIRDRENGLLAAPGEPAALARAVEELADGTLAARLTACAGAEVRARYTVERMATATAAMYEEGGR